MEKIDLRRWLSSFLANYGRRFMEPVYDKVAQTESFENLKNQDPIKKYSLEVAINALTALISQKIDAKTPLSQVVNEVFMDASSEINKRMINGDTLRNLFGNNGKEALKKKQDIEEFFFSLEENELLVFLGWLKGLSEKERLEALEMLKKISDENKQKFASMESDTRESLLQVLKKKKKLSAFTNPLREKLIADLKR